jgi:electron transfer flavoprotein beta subunit
MDILVCLKRVPLAGSTFLLTSDSKDIDTNHLAFGISPHEENAVEAGVQLVEQMGGTLTLLTLGPTDAEEQLRSQLAIGASRAILLETEGEDWDPQGTAAALVEAVQAEETKFDLLLFGAESADNAGYQIHIRLAHALGLPIVTNVKSMKIENGIARCERVVGATREIYETPLPAVITVRDGLNIPRYPSVPGRIQSRKKPIDHKKPTSRVPKLEKLSLSVAPSNTGGAKVLGSGAEAVPALVEVLQSIGILA